MTYIEKLTAIALERGIDTTNIFGKVELLKEILVHQSPNEANEFMIDTFIMLDDEIDHAFKELGLEKDTQ